MINFDFPLLDIASNNIWQSIAILAVVVAIFKIIKDTSAEERSWSWCATLFALALLPMAAFLPGEGFSLISEQSQNLAPAPITIEQAAPTQQLAPKVVLKELPLGVVTLPSYSKSDVMMLLLGLWFLGTIVAFIRLIIAAFNAYTIRSRSYPYAMEEEWPETVEIVVSDEISGPIVIGFIKPIIVLPVSFAKSMATDQLMPLLQHELAHIKRHDNIFYLIECIVLSLYWWNPVMHYIAARISEERELACDDRAAYECGDQMKYAKSLLSGARQLIGPNRSVLGMAVLRRESALSKRVKRMTVSDTLYGLDFLRLGRNLSLIVASLLVLGLATPRWEVSNAQDTNLQENLDEEVVIDTTGHKLTKEELIDIKTDILDSIRDIEIEIDVEEIVESLEEAFENFPTEEMIIEMQEDIKEGLKNLPSQLEIAEMRAEVELSLENLHEIVDVEAILAEVDAEFENLIIEFDEEKIRFEIERALAELPTKEEIEQMKDEVRRELKEVIKEKEEMNEIRKELKRELKRLHEEIEQPEVPRASALPELPTSPVAPVAPVKLEGKVSF